MKFFEYLNTFRTYIDDINATIFDDASIAKLLDGAMEFIYNTMISYSYEIRTEDVEIVFTTQEMEIVETTFKYDRILHATVNEELIDVTTKTLAQHSQKPCIYSLRDSAYKLKVGWYSSTFSDLTVKLNLLVALAKFVEHPNELNLELLDIPRNFHHLVLLRAIMFAQKVRPRNEELAYIIRSWDPIYQEEYAKAIEIMQGHSQQGQGVLDVDGRYCY